MYIWYDFKNCASKVKKMLAYINYIYYLCTHKTIKTMATIKELVSNYQVNEPITDKRILSYFKKLGFIWDYSQWGYLESVIVYPSNDNEYDIQYYIFNQSNAKELEKYPMAVWCENGKVYRQQSARTDIPTNDDIREIFGYGSNFEWDNYVFSTKYVSGCFNPCLVINEIKNN